MSFVIGSYQAVEHPGGGHRASAAGLWRGVDLRTVNDVAMTVLPADCADAARLAVESVAVIRHPHLLPVLDVSQDDDRVAVVCPWPTGGRLAELVVRRGRLTVGETLTVLIPLAAALAAVHAAGIRHGEVCPEAVWFDANGRPLLGAPAVSRLIAELNDGLPAGSKDVAPEVIRADKAPENPITPAADVFSLGSVALFCLTGRSAWPADDPVDVLIQSAAGLWPDMPEDAGPPGVVALVREMLRAEPARRPSAVSLAARLGKVGEPSPIIFGSGPTPAPESADRWRGWSAGGVDTEPASAGPADREQELTGPRDSQLDASPADEPSTVRPPGEPGGRRSAAALWWRAATGRRTGDAARGSGDHARWFDAARPADADRPADPTDPEAVRQMTPVARAGVALLVGLLVTVVGLQIGLWSTGWEESTSSAAADATAGADVTTVADATAGVTATAGPDSSLEPAPAVDPVGSSSWSDVVVGLDVARGRAFDAADPALLAEVYLDGTSAAGAADAAVVGQLADNGLRVVDAVHQIVSVTIDGDPTSPADGSTDAAAGDGVRLAVVDTLPAHPIVDAAGRQVGLTPARAEQRRILVLSPTGNGYRISSVEAG